MGESRAQRLSRLAPHLGTPAPRAVAACLPVALQRVAPAPRDRTRGSIGRFSYRCWCRVVAREHPSATSSVASSMSTPGGSVTGPIYSCPTARTVAGDAFEYLMLVPLMGDRHQPDVTRHHRAIVDVHRVQHGDDDRHVYPARAEIQRTKWLIRVTPVDSPMTPHDVSHDLHSCSHRGPYGSRCSVHRASARYCHRPNPL